MCWGAGEFGGPGSLGGGGGGLYSPPTHGVMMQAVSSHSARLHMCMCRDFATSGKGRCIALCFMQSCRNADCCVCVCVCVQMCF